jgi:hypothetical protein
MSMGDGMSVRRRLDVKGRELVTEMLSAGNAASAVSEALETDGHGKWSPDHIRRHYAHQPVVVKALEEARVRVIEQGVAERVERVSALWKRAKWVEEAIEKLSIADLQPAVLKTLLSEFREYSKQVAQEMGEWQERKDVTSGGRSIVFNLSVLSTEEVEQLGRLRAKLESHSG